MLTKSPCPPLPGGEGLGSRINILGEKIGNFQRYIVIFQTGLLQKVFEGIDYHVCVLLVMVELNHSSVKLAVSLKT